MRGSCDRIRFCRNVGLEIVTTELPSALSHLRGYVLRACLCKGGLVVGANNNQPGQIDRQTSFVCLPSASRTAGLPSVRCPAFRINTSLTIIGWISSYLIACGISSILLSYLIRWRRDNPFLLGKWCVRCGPVGNVVYIL